jgi:hypothetical protein
VYTQFRAGFTVLSLDLAVEHVPIKSVMALMLSHGNASGGGAEDPEATEVGDFGVDAREAGGAHGAERVPVQVAAVGRLHLQQGVEFGLGLGPGLGLVYS